MKAVESYVSLWLTCYYAHKTFEQVPQRFDLILLGMGEEGHTASLFPETPALAETESWVVAVVSKDPPRVMLTYSILNSASTVAFLVSGANKVGALHEVIDESDAADLPPAARIHPANGVLRFFVDNPAASKLGGINS